MLFDQGTLGEARVLPEYGSGYLGKRVLAFLLILLPLAPVVWLIQSERRANATAREWSLKVSLAANFAVAGLAILSYALLRNYFDFGAFARVGAGAGAVAFAFAAAFAAAFAFAFAFAAARVFARVFAGVFAGVFAAAFAAAVTAAVTAAGAVTGAFATLVFLGFILQRIQHEVGKVTVVVVTLLMIGIAAAIFTPKYAVDSDRLTAGNISFILLVFFCILPVLNALFDWLSVGVTRLFLRR